MIIYRSSKKLIEQSNNQGTVSKLSSGFTKIKGALRTQPIEGAMFPTESQPYESNSTIFIEQNTNRDLSCWRVSITQVEQVNFNNFLQLNLSKINYLGNNGIKNSRNVLHKRKKNRLLFRK